MSSCCGFFGDFIIVELFFSLSKVFEVDSLKKLALMMKITMFCLKGDNFILHLLIW